MEGSADPLSWGWCCAPPRGGQGSSWCENCEGPGRWTRIRGGGQEGCLDQSQNLRIANVIRSPRCPGHRLGSRGHGGAGTHGVQWPCWRAAGVGEWARRLRGTACGVREGFKAEAFEPSLGAWLGVLQGPADGAGARCAAQMCAHAGQVRAPGRPRTSHTGSDSLVAAGPGAGPQRPFISRRESYS